jgi:hypothetical protein
MGSIMQRPTDRGKPDIGPPFRAVLPPPHPPRPAPRHRYPLSDRFRAARGGGWCRSPSAAARPAANRSGGTPRLPRAGPIRRPARGRRNSSVGGGERRGGRPRPLGRTTGGRPAGPRRGETGGVAYRGECRSRKNLSECFGFGASTPRFSPLQIAERPFGSVTTAWHYGRRCRPGLKG